METPDELSEGYQLEFRGYMISGGRSPDGLKCGKSSAAFNFKSSWYGWVIGCIPDALYRKNDQRNYIRANGSLNRDTRCGASCLALDTTTGDKGWYIGAVGCLPLTTQKHFYKLNTPCMLAER